MVHLTNLILNFHSNLFQKQIEWMFQGGETVALPSSVIEFSIFGVWMFERSVLFTTTLSDMIKSHVLVTLLQIDIFENNLLNDNGCYRCELPVQVTVQTTFRQITLVRYRFDATSSNELLSNLLVATSVRYVIKLPFLSHVSTVTFVS